MRAFLGPTGCLIGLALAGCSMLAPDPSISVTGDHPMSWDDVREIERLLPALGIHRPIYAIRMQGADRAEVSCAVSPSLSSGAAADTFRREGIVTFPADVFTAFRRNSHWYADRSSVQKTAESLADM
jgi:hypothetical protein